MKSVVKTGISRLRCAIYTRKSSEEGLEQSFNSLDAQREACEAYIKSQCHEGWELKPTHYDDGGFSGGTMERPALARLIEHIKQGHVSIIVVYKVDRLSRSLADFVRLIELFDQYKVSFVSVTQQFNTSTSMGRLTLNVLLSFAQFEREVTGERIRDKIAASKQKGMWMGGVVPIGYDVEDKQLVINLTEAKTVRHIYSRYLALGCVRKLKNELDNTGYVSKARNSSNGASGGKLFSRGALYTLLKNPLYIGKIAHNGQHYSGQHAALVKTELWEQVQQRLASNKISVDSKTHAKVPSLLTGILYDDQGNRMSPTHATKQNRRYRYYISQAIQQYREADGGSVIRIPAQIVEDAVTSDIKRLLGNSHELLQNVITHKLTATKQKALIDRAKSMANELNGWPFNEKISFLKRVVRAAIVSQASIHIQYSKSAISKILSGGHPKTDDNNISADDDVYDATIPASLKRCGMETKLVIPGTNNSKAHHLSISAIQRSLSKALIWNQALITGSASSLSELAKNENVAQRHVSRYLKLAFLAPDIIDSIFKGNIPDTLTLKYLTQGIPLDWQEQRTRFGFI